MQVIEVLEDWGASGRIFGDHVRRFAAYPDDPESSVSTLTPLAILLRSLFVPLIVTRRFDIGPMCEGKLAWP